MKKLNFHNPVFYDIETSGVRHWEHEIIQIAAYAPATGDEFEVKLHFDQSKASDEALAVNSFDPTVWEQIAVSKRVALEEFSEFMRQNALLQRVSKKNGKQYWVTALIGHNIVKFDDQWIEKAYRDTGLFRPADYRTYDTLQLAQWVLPGRESYKLGDLAGYFGLDNAGAHDALEDVKMNVQIAAKLLQMTGIDCPEWVRKVSAKPLVDEDDLPF